MKKPHSHFLMLWQATAFVRQHSLGRGALAVLLHRKSRSGLAVPATHRQFVNVGIKGIFIQECSAGERQAIIVSKRIQVSAAKAFQNFGHTNAQHF
jgi:hypothetical protein